MTTIVGKLDVSTNATLAGPGGAVLSRNGGDALTGVGDGHIDWGASQFVSEQMHVGLVGYFYRQLSGDSGAGARLGNFKSRVNGIGPQIGYLFKMGERQAYVNLKAYHEFDARNRPEGWNVRLTLSIPLGLAKK